MHEPRDKLVGARIEAARRSTNEGERQRLLLDALDGIWRNQVHTYQLFAGTPEAEPRRSGGGVSIIAPPAPLRLVGEILSTADPMAHPQRWVTTMGGGKAHWNYLAVENPCIIESLVGFVHVESMGSRDQIRRYVWMSRRQGTGAVPARTLVGLTYRFTMREGVDNGRFSVYTYLAGRDGLHADGDTRVAGSESQYVSDEAVLTPALQTDYDRANGGAGLKMIRLQLYAFAR